MALVAPAVARGWWWAGTLPWAGIRSQDGKSGPDGGRRLRVSAASSPKAAAVANYFNRSEQHKSRGRRIGRDGVRAQELTVEDIEGNEGLQDIVLTNYHLGTLIFEKSPCCKFIVSNQGKAWIKNIAAQMVIQ